MIQDLIYDIGMHKGEDTLYYLKKGCLPTRQPFLFITNPDFVSGWG